MTRVTCITVVGAGHDRNIERKNRKKLILLTGAFTFFLIFCLSSRLLIPILLLTKLDI